MEYDRGIKLKEKALFQSVLEAVLCHAKDQPDRLCLADDERSVTYQEYVTLIRKYAAVFEALGIRRGEHVLVEANQTIDYLAIQLAVQLLGAVFIPVEHNCAEGKIVSFCKTARVQAAVINKKAELPEQVILLTHEEIREMGEQASPVEITTLPEGDEVCEILFSTGTTGKEKGIVLTHKNNIALAQNVIHGVKMEADNVEMIPSPMNHSHGLRRYYANMYNGSSVVLLGSVMNLRKFFENMDVYGVNSMDLVPSALTVILRLSKNKISEYADRIRYLQFGSAPLLAGDVEKICSYLPGVPMYNIYGSTESGCTLIYDFNRPDTKKSCVGKPTYNTTVLMVDDDRNPIESSPERPGLVATYGSMNMLHYWEDEEETAKAMAEGIIYSSDMGYLDADGDVILVGRKGDVINVGGNKVSPDEIENAARKMPEIADCGCIGVPDQSKGQVPKLYVKMKPKTEFDEKAIASFLRSSLEPYKVPVYIEKTSKIPRTFNGKLLRRELGK